MDKDRHLIREDTPLLQALQRLNAFSGEVLTLFVVSDNGTVVGSLTDGDVRRGLIAGASLDSPVSRVMHCGFRFVRRGEDNFREFRNLRSKGIDLVPELDAEGRITGIINLRKQISCLPLDAVLMAGGRGERLRPLTLKTPKPLLPVGGKAIIDYNVEALVRNGVKKIYATVNYLKEQIERHFDTPVEGVRVQCVAEPQRMGTIGSLSLCKGLDSPNVLVMNSDLLTTLSYERMYARHIDAEADITMAVVPYSVNIPFAIINTEGDHISGMTEKPTYNYLANAGIYILKRELLSLLHKGEYMDAPDFVTSVIRSGGKVTYYQIEGIWIDIGSPDDYRYANELMSLR